eukprot:1868244-Pyramimonas_sp.AAC.1
MCSCEGEQGEKQWGERGRTERGDGDSDGRDDPRRGPARRIGRNLLERAAPAGAPGGPAELLRAAGGERDRGDGRGGAETGGAAHLRDGDILSPLT